MGIGVSEEIPRRACPLRHCVCFALCGASAARTCGIYPIRHLGKRRFTRICRLIRINIGQAERKLTFGNRNITAFSHLTIGIGSPQYLWRLNTQSLSLKLIFSLPLPSFSSQSIMACLASSTLMPLIKPLFTRVPVAQSVKASF